MLQEDMREKISNITNKLVLFEETNAKKNDHSSECSGHCHCCSSFWPSNHITVFTNDTRCQTKSGNKINAAIDVLNIILISIISIMYFTWLFSNDRYVLLNRLKMDVDLKVLETANKYSDQRTDIDLAVKKCKEWFTAYKRKTKRSFFSKLTIGPGLITAGIGLTIDSSIVAIAGTFAAVSAGCYLLWIESNLIENKDLEKKFNEALSCLNKIPQNTAVPEQN